MTGTEEPGGEAKGPEVKDRPEPAIRPTPLDYHYAREAASSYPHGILFWFVYAFCVAFSLCALTGAFETVLWGRRGDVVVATSTIVSTGVVTGMVVASYGLWLRRIRLAYGLTVAAAAGLGAPFPAYAALWLLF